MRWLFTPIIAGKAWNGNTVLTQPLGGSESAVAYIAQALARKGEEVHVITHGEPVVDFCGVHYTQQDWGRAGQEEWDVVVSSRWVEALNWPWKTAKKILWLHDVANGALPPVSATKLVMLSNFQVATYGLQGHEMVRIIGNGVDGSLASFTVNEGKESNKLIWCANPDRGLAMAAKIFQQIRKRWPDMELHVYGRAAVYGWGPQAEAPYLPRIQHLDYVFLHDPLPRAELFKVLATSWAYFYPTYWPETYCIATLEAQAVGLPVIASPYAALLETVKGGILSNDFLNAVSQLRNKNRWEKCSFLGQQWAQENTWDKQADKWLEMAHE